MKRGVGLGRRVRHLVHYFSFIVGKHNGINSRTIIRGRKFKGCSVTFVLNVCVLILAESHTQMLVELLQNLADGSVPYSIAI